MPPKIAFNPYEVLGLERNCSEKDIQKAYRQQCLRWHPDKNLDNKEEAERRFIKAKEAFQFLYEKEKRVEYDRDYEREKHREATHRARMEKADSEKRIRAEFELLRQRLEKEAADEIHAQQERLARLAREQAASTADAAKTEEKHATLRVKWRPSDDSDYDEEKLREIFGSYGAISMITPIRTTKKGDKICMIEFDASHNEWGAELEQGKDGPAISASWLIPPCSPKGEGDNATKSESAEKVTDFASMSYEELQAKLFADMAPPEEKRKKWTDEVE
ncbi:unnamed protein product [Nippostrongylus brasiliensis]|uniref:DnaJ homolog subfamily C member 17 (inferred by orthology to a human protein) n=1 Tax=Nippostrongylus brasiliensis TaxID=27835 RepID=A0A0N4XX92_NIPBR|nr:unnamed protein product [Nippostrongylus brasiliensis]